MIQKQLLKKIFDFEKDKNEIYYINDRTGNIRWLFPKGSKYPSFLALYNSSTFKGKVYKLLCEIAFKIKIKKLVISGVLKARLKENIADLINRLNGDSYSVFTGTPGEDRKIVIAVSYNKNVTYFIKYAISESSRLLIKNENMILKELNLFSFKEIKIPNIAFYQNDIIAISNIKPNKIIETNKFSEKHLYALSEIYDNFSYIKSIETTKLYMLIIDNVLKLNTDGKMNSKLTLFRSCLSLLNKTLKKNYFNEKCVMSYAHGDFTPWNMYVGESRLYVYDWEQSAKDVPLLFDFFHYIFQTEILVNHQGYSKIINKIKDYIDEEIFQQLIQKYSIDININYSFYICYISTYYMGKYTLQDNLLVQAHWLLEVWHEALSNIVDTNNKVFG